MEKLSIATYLRIKPSLKSEISPITYDLEGLYDYIYIIENKLIY